MNYVDEYGYAIQLAVPVAVIKAVTAIVDYGLDLVEAGSDLYVIYLSPNASETDKEFARQNLALIALTESAEPDEFAIANVPADNLARATTRKFRKEAVERAARETAEEVGERVTRSTVPVCKVNEPRIEEHHFATNKSKKWTAQLQDVANRYGLDLDEPWNKEKLVHRGRHPDAYHDWVLEQMTEADAFAKGDRTKFLAEFEKRVKSVVEANPSMLRKEFWE